jgi:translation initiation factor IF-2
MREEAEAMRAAEVEREKKLVRVNEFITVSELAQILKVSPTEIVGFAFKNLGLMITVNQRLDFDQIELIAGEFGFQAVREDEYQAEEVGSAVADEPEDLVPRPPVVTIMGPRRPRQDVAARLHPQGERRRRARRAASRSTSVPTTSSCPAGR